VFEDTVCIHAQSWHRVRCAIYHQMVCAVLAMACQHALSMSVMQMSCQDAGESAGIQN